MFTLVFYLFSFNFEVFYFLKFFNYSKLRFLFLNKLIRRVNLKLFNVVFIIIHIKSSRVQVRSVVISVYEILTLGNSDAVFALSAFIELFWAADKMNRGSSASVRGSPASVRGSSAFVRGASVKSKKKLSRQTKFFLLFFLWPRAPQGQGTCPGMLG